MSVEGQLSDLGVVDVLHLICLRRKPAQLTVMKGGATGRVVVGEGQIVHARVGALSGEGAVVELLGWRDGIFKVSEAPSLPERNVRASLTELMTRAARAGTSDLPHAPAPPREEADPRARKADRELDAALVRHFARLEREVARFEGLRPGPRCAGQAVAIVEAILARIVEMGGTHLGTGFAETALKRLVARHIEITPALRLAEVRQGKISLDAIRGMLDGLPAGAQRAQLYAELAAGSLGLVNGLLHQLGRGLGDDELHRQWRETFEAFLADLAGALDAVKT